MPDEKILNHGMEVTGAAFSKDGEMIATCGNDCQLFVYKTGKARIVILVFTSEVWYRTLVEKSHIIQALP